VILSSTLPYAFTEHGSPSKIEVHDEAISSLFKALRELLEPVLPEERKKIGLK